MINILKYFKIFVSSVGIAALKNMLEFYENFNYLVVLTLPPCLSNYKIVIYFF